MCHTHDFLQLQIQLALGQFSIQIWCNMVWARPTNFFQDFWVMLMFKMIAVSLNEHLIVLNHANIIA